MGSIPGQGTKIPQAMLMAKKKKKKESHGNLDPFQPTIYLWELFLLQYVAIDCSFSLLYSIIY